MTSLSQLTGHFIIAIRKFAGTRLLRLLHYKHMLNGKVSISKLELKSCNMYRECVKNGSDVLMPSVDL